ncbi:hypothetical protein Asn12ST33_10330 [Cutibacterium acnes]|nr:hypothetical protein Asn12ST33_10330 [Cutibacterium acnes]
MDSVERLGNLTDAYAPSQPLVAFAIRLVAGDTSPIRPPQGFRDGALVDPGVRRDLSVTTRGTSGCLEPGCTMTTYGRQREIRRHAGRLFPQRRYMVL